MRLLSHASSVNSSCGHAVRCRSHLTHKNLPLSIRWDLYDEAIRLASDEGWGYKKVSKNLSYRHKLRVPPSTVHSWLKRRHTPYGSCNILEARPSNKLAYLVGATLGDGSIYRAKLHYNDEIKLAVVDRDFAESFAECLFCVFPFHQRFKISATSYDGCGRYIVRVGSSLLADFLSQPLNQLDRFIRPHAAAFLRGLFDAEGSVLVSPNGGRRLSVRLELTNSDTEMLDYAQELLAELRINSRAGQYKRASPVILSIRGKPVCFSSPTFWLQIAQQLSLHRFAENVGFTIERKQRKLAVALSLIRSVGTQEAATEWLRIYTKKGSRWVKRDRAPELDEASLSRDSFSENGPVVQPVKTPPSQ